MLNRRFAFIDGLRGIAVLAVVTCHTLGSPRWLPHGSRGVDLFFVISGWCLAAPYLAGKPLDLRTFYARRFARIVPPYMIALAVFVALGATAFGLPFDRNHHADVPRALASEAGLFSLGLFPIHDPAFWSIGVEARWYLIAPLLIVLYRRAPNAFYVLGLACYAAYQWTALLDLGTLPAFMLGIAAAGCKGIRFAGPAAVLAIAAGTLLQSERYDSHTEPIWHLAAFFVVVAARDWTWTATPLLVRIGGASYSIYLAHYPIVFWLLLHHAVPPWVAALVAIALGLAFWFAVERPLLALRDRIEPKGASRSERAPVPWSAPATT